jgi:hypothetical protein
VKKTNDKKQGCQTSSRGYIQEVYFLQVFALLERVRCATHDRWLHVQKNMFESIIGTLLDIKGKTKEGINPCMDLVNLGIKRTTSYSSSSYNLNVDEKHVMCVWFKNLKVPSRFCSSIWSIVSMKDLTVTNYNSHDCHVMLTTFLPIAIRAINPLFLKMTITQLCYFFNIILEKVIDHDELASLQEFVVETVS